MRSDRFLGYRLKESELISFINQYADYTSEQLKDKSLPMYQRHKIFTDWVLTVLYFASLHRPVKDPFCLLRNFYPEKGICLIEDKVIQESRRYGLAPLCDIAIEQLLIYIKYLEILANWCFRRKGIADLGHTILSIFENQNAPDLPLFFYFNETGHGLRGVEAGSVNEVWSSFIEIPPNEHRRVVASALASRNVPAELIRMALRHEDNLHSNFDFTGKWSPREAFELLNKKIDSLLRSWGFIVIASPLFGSTDSKRPKKLKQDPIYTRPLGYIQREADRLKRYDLNGKTVKAALSKPRSTFLLKRSTLSRVDVEQLIDTVKVTARNNGASVSRCIAILRRFLGFIKTSREANFVLRAQIPVPNTKGIIEYDLIENGKRAVAIQHKLLQLIAETCWQSVKPENIAAALLVSGVLFDEVWDTLVVECLRCQLETGGYRLNSRILIDAYIDESRRNQSSCPDFRWHLGELSTSLFFRLHQVSCEKKISEQKILSSLDKILKFLLPETQKKHRLSKLCKIFKDNGFVEMHPLGRAYHDTSSGNTELSQLSLMRLLGDINRPVNNKKYLCPPIANLALEENRSDKSTILQISGSNKELKNLIDKIFNKNKNTPAQGKLRKRRPRLASLKSELVTLLRSKQWSSAGEALMRWLIDMCENGTQRKRVPKVSAIATYKSMICGPLLTHLGNAEITRLTIGSFEMLYWSMLHHANPKDRTAYVGRMRDFHQFGERALGFTRIDWSTLYAEVNKYRCAFRNTVADANIITFQEYRSALELIVPHPGRAPHDQCQIAVALIMGYRFGLRFDEAVGLMSHQIRTDPYFNFIMLNVRTNVYIDGKSQAFTRNIPLLSSLIETEKEILKRIIHSAKQTWRATNLMPLLMARQGTTRKLTEDKEMSRRVNACLREATGDPSIHFNHLRHTWASAIELRFWEKTYGVELSELNAIKQGEQFFDKRLWGQDDYKPSINEMWKIIGHVDESTIISTYMNTGKLCYQLMRRSNTNIEFNAALASVLNISDDALRQRRSRECNCTYSTQYSFPLSAREIKKISAIEIQWEQKENGKKAEKSEEFLSAVVIDRILCDYAQEKEDLGVLAKAHGLSIENVRHILNIGIGIEERSGYDRYKLNEVSLAGTSTFSNELHNRSENIRFARFLSQLSEQPELSHLREDKNLLSFIDIWQRAYTPSQSFLTILDLSSIEIIRYGLHALGSYRTKIQIITSKKTPESILKRANDFGDQIVQLDSFNPKHVLQPVQSNSVGVRFLQLPKKIGTMSTFHRLMFIVSVLVQS